MRFFSLAVALGLLSGSAHAQQPPSLQSPSDKASYMSATELAAALAKGPADRPSSSW
jgi:hypothetical protein